MSDFERLYQQHGKTVYYYLLSLCGEEALAEELTQETMYRAILNIGAFRGECKLSVWLCQIAKRAYFAWRKKNARNVPLDDAGPLPDGRDLAEDFADKDTAHQILRYAHELAEPYKEVFILHALGDVPLVQISQLYGKSESWARVTYYRAKMMITKKLKEGTP